MIFVKCPYCNKEINILFGEEIKNLINKGITDCKCNSCEKVFEVYQGNIKYEVKMK